MLSSNELHSNHYLEELDFTLLEKDEDSQAAALQLQTQCHSTFC